jgi:hypothetical protein
MTKDQVKPAPPPANDDLVPDELVRKARQALAMKLSAPQPVRPESRSADLGMAPLPNEATTHELSLQSEGVKPVMQPHKGR